VLTNIRKRDALPYTDLGWVQIRDHFIVTVGPRSGTGTALADLVVLADARLPVGSRFPLHPHADMEILTIVLEGDLLHTEPTQEEVVPARSVQWISAGDGIVHAEGNAGDVPVHLLQIWIKPARRGGLPRYAVTPLPALDRTFQRISPPELQTTVSMARLAAGDTAELRTGAGQLAYLLVTEGSLQLAGEPIDAGDAAVARGLVHLTATEPTSVVAITTLDHERK
jgi:quercetin 2,3-dioxygenase